MNEIHVRTTLSEPLYEALSRTARNQRRPLKAVLREAVEAYVATRSDLSDDTLMGFVGKGRLRERDWSERKDWRA